MPYEWLPPEDRVQRLHLWPHRSLGRGGFIFFICLTAVLISVPLLAALGTSILWGLLPFHVGAILAIWFALRKNGRDREIVEDLRMSPASIVLVRHGPNGNRHEWQADPFWVRVTLHPTAGPVPNYLTLKGNGREVALGAFLSEDERIRLRDDVQRALNRTNR